jgi:hypothetical protein
MQRHKRFKSATNVVFAGAACLLGMLEPGWSRGPTSAASASAQFSGEAGVINLVDVHTGPASILIANTGTVPSADGSREATITATNMQGLSLELAHAFVRGMDNETIAESSVHNLALTIRTESGATHMITAELITAQASATCTSGGASLAANAQITGLAIDGLGLEVTHEPNQKLVFDEWTLIINEQSITTMKSGGTAEAAALHILVHNYIQGTVGYARAGIRCPKGASGPTAECEDWLTGRGWIEGTPSGERSNFGIGGGIRKGRFWGHLDYIDHGMGMQVKATAVTGYQASGPSERLINYDVTIDGEPGNALVRVIDNGESGRDDTFEIQLSNGYFAGLSLGGEGPGGGNIQLHKSMCGRGKQLPASR